MILPGRCPVGRPTYDACSPLLLTIGGQVEQRTPFAPTGRRILGFVQIRPMFLTQCSHWRHYRVTGEAAVSCQSHPSFSVAIDPRAATPSPHLHRAVPGNHLTRAAHARYPRSGAGPLVGLVGQLDRQVSTSAVRAAASIAGACAHHVVPYETSRRPDRSSKAGVSAPCAFRPKRHVCPASDCRPRIGKVGPSRQLHRSLKLN
jgi:hypothetical protein